jgi:hypothetical protein
MLTRGLALFMTINLFLGSVVDLHDIAKVPYMLAHYQQHKSKSGHFSFTDFMNLHYGSKAKKHDKEEHEQHKGLPFKTHDCTYAHVVTLLVAFHPSQMSSFETSITYTNFYQSAFISSFSEAIWQPPRLA